MSPMRPRSDLIRSVSSAHSASMSFDTNDMQTTGSILITNIDLIERDVVKKLLHHKSDFLKDISKNSELRDKMVVISLDTLAKFDFTEF